MQTETLTEQRAELGASGALDTSGVRGGGDAKAAFESPSGLCAPKAIPGQVWMNSLAKGAMWAVAELTRGREDRERRPWFWWHAHSTPSLQGLPQPCEPCASGPSANTAAWAQTALAPAALGASSPRSACRQDWPLPRPLFLACRLLCPRCVPSLCPRCVLTGERSSPWGPLYKDMNPLPQAPLPATVTSQVRIQRTVSGGDTVWSSARLL